MAWKGKHNPSARIELLGIGSAKNRAFRANLEEALRQLSWEIPIEEVEEISQLLRYGISGIPALVVNGKVVFEKIVPSVEDLKIVLNVLLSQEDPVRPLRQIVVPVDFSSAAENALFFAYEMARAVGADLRFVHVHQPPLDLGNTLRLEAGTIDEVEYKLRLIEGLKRRLREKFPCAKEGAVACPEVEGEMITGFVNEEIQRLSQDRRVDLIVMGTTGETGLLGRWLGSTSSEVARRAQCPVILVPKGAGFHGIHNLVYASNYHPAEEKVLPEIVNFGSQFKANIHFVHINENKLTPYSLRNGEGEAKFYQNGVVFQLSTVESKDIVLGLSRYNEQVKSDLLIMATVRRSPMEELFYRSHTRKMVFNTRIPLMVMHLS